MWLSSFFAAAQSLLPVYLQERGELLSNYLSGQLSLQKASERSRIIHAYFRENKHKALAQEEGMYNGFLLFFREIMKNQSRR